ncbi:hypothetical protein PR202_ga29693 [Eleusine coracana subsp. coracana]|uniref:Uncharacterized protein n=1 Tax=Eleusine coracana subsp. coracana TaxID=191504 RepID=A0AAV5DM32_ELECO|nr:hypothetical protein PR202_ga29693 [Eleusine coracana subsp. coracana]
MAKAHSFGPIAGSTTNVLRSSLSVCLLHAVPKARSKVRTVREALTNRTWASDISGALTVGVLVEYLQLWDLLEDIALQPEVEDSHIWKLSSSGQYSAKSACDGLFLGAT